MLSVIIVMGVNFVLFMVNKKGVNFAHVKFEEC